MASCTNEVKKSVPTWLSVREYVADSAIGRKETTGASTATRENRERIVRRVDSLVVELASGTLLYLDGICFATKICTGHESRARDARCPKPARFPARQITPYNGHNEDTYTQFSVS